MFLLGLLFVMMASGFALLWVYAGGDLSAKNIRKTLPVLRRDVDAYFLTAGKKVEVAFEGAQPYVKVSGGGGIPSGKWVTGKNVRQFGLGKVLTNQLLLNSPLITMEITAHD